MSQMLYDDDAPDWRWQVITTMVAENSAPSRREEDAWIRNGVHFLRRYKNYRIIDVLNLKRDYPYLYKAHNLYANDDSVRWIIEAAALSEATDEQIAEYVGQPIDVVREYITLFFDIKSKLKATGFIMNRILMPALGRGMHQRDFDFLFKTLAYCCGWEEFKAFINQAPMSKDMEDFFTRSFRQSVIKNGWLATKRIDINNFNAVSVMDLTMRLMEMEKGGDNTPKAQQQVQQLIGDLLNHCKLAIIPSRETLAMHEPRATEMLTGEKGLKYGDPIPLQKQEK